MAQVSDLAMADPKGRLRVHAQSKTSAFGVAPRHSTEMLTMNNLIALIGHVGQAPHSVSFEDTGNKVVKFSLAVKEFSSNTDEEKTLWIDIDAWNGLGDRVLSNVTKGREIAVQGRLSLATFTNEVDGVKVPVTKPVVNLTSYHLCGRKPVAEETQSVATETEPKSRRGFRLAATKG
ncbi:MAG: single-strand DNA-binding protein [Cyanobacteriota bacterium erpe_2018_sw_21hr_WHONDRS-SW48-000092_B_bin.40]|nr:single-strand DNA-binding protein [Cyanobacteriota bacterium erpe_2018_sw_21hr_WHONDRS-SW48-000092_B_bin.40]